MIQVATKPCSLCARVLPRESFGLCAGNKTTGLSPRCRDCKRSERKAKYDENRAKFPRVHVAKTPCPKCGGPMSCQARTCKSCASYPDRRGANSPRWAGGYYVKFGITPEDYKFFFEMQRGLCAICEKPETNRRPSYQGGGVKVLSVDHDHQTGKVRGLLCGNCNRALGLMKDDVGRIDRAASYLRKHKEVSGALSGRPVSE